MQKQYQTSGRCVKVVYKGKASINLQKAKTDTQTQSAPSCLSPKAAQTTSMVLEGG